MLHSLSMSLFSSVIGPFGGFFASGFKRAFKIKVRQIELKKGCQFNHIEKSFCNCRILETLFRVMAALWTASTVSTWWPPLSMSTFLPLSALIHLSDSCNKWLIQHVVCHCILLIHLFVHPHRSIHWSRNCNCNYSQLWKIHWLPEGSFNTCQLHEKEKKLFLFCLYIFAPTGRI